MMSDCRSIPGYLRILYPYRPVKHRRERRIVPQRHWRIRAVKYAFTLVAGAPLKVPGAKYTLCALRIGFAGAPTKMLVLLATS